MKLGFSVSAVLILGVSASSRTFGCAGRQQDVLYKEPTEIKATLWGGSGGNANTDYPSKGGQGGFTDVTFKVTAGTRVRYTVGCAGRNGSGRGTRGGGSGGGGTGIQTIRQDGHIKVIAAAGGGGGGSGCKVSGGGDGGAGGGTTGKNGDSSGFGGNLGGRGASSKGSGAGSSGDRGEPNGGAGGSYKDGNGGDGGNSGGRRVHVSARSFGFGRGGTSTIRSADCGGGGGGGGWYGGGGGASGGHGSGGGGGSGKCNFDELVRCFTLQGNGINSGNPQDGKINVVEKTLTAPTTVPTPAPTPGKNKIATPICKDTICTYEKGVVSVGKLTAFATKAKQEKYHCHVNDGACECRCHKDFHCTIASPLIKPDGTPSAFQIRRNHC